MRTHRLLYEDSIVLHVKFQLFMSLIPPVVQAAATVHGEILLRTVNALHDGVQEILGSTE